MKKYRRGRRNSVIHVNEKTLEKCGDGFYQRFEQTGPVLLHYQCIETWTLKCRKEEYPGCQTDATRVTNVSGI